ncbi:hypothetical protein T4A_1854 [Trichinella pseudospiralis]|uniref:Uncharacterized protein n=1 Tax=Trichinella pseudospiralis TaxID=6337 RepID=A0A0V1DNH1_TRIPS|nr:hypothetical protein T4A_1854 [Trichinella pseudospiralis]
MSSFHSSASCRPRSASCRPRFHFIFSSLSISISLIKRYEVWKAT